MRLIFKKAAVVAGLILMFNILTTLESAHHENLHATIYEMYGVPAKAVVSFPDSYTIAYYSNAPDVDNATRRHIEDMQAMVEAYSYPIADVEIAIYAYGSIIVYLLLFHNSIQTNIK